MPDITKSYLLEKFLSLVSPTRSQSQYSLTSTWTDLEKQIPTSRAPLSHEPTSLTTFQCADIDDSWNWASFPSNKATSGRVPPINLITLPIGLLHWYYDCSRLVARFKARSIPKPKLSSISVYTTKRSALWKRSIISVMYVLLRGPKFPIWARSRDLQA